MIAEHDVEIGPTRGRDEQAEAPRSAGVVEDRLAGEVECVTRQGADLEARSSRASPLAQRFAASNRFSRGRHEVSITHSTLQVTAHDSRNRLDVYIETKVGADDPHDARLAFSPQFATPCPHEVQP